MYDEQSRSQNNLKTLAEIIPIKTYGSPKVTSCNDKTMHVSMKKADFIMPFKDLIRVISTNQGKAVVQKIKSSLHTMLDRGAQK